MKNQNPPPYPPRFLLGSTLLFWGWQNGLIPIAVFMALVLESACYVRFRWDFSAAELNRISDLCALIFIGMALYLFLADRSVFIIFTLLAWLPMTFFPLMFAQNFSVQESIDIRTISLFLRKQKQAPGKHISVSINLNYPFFALTILCSSFANLRDARFYLGLILLSAWALLSVRPGHRSPFLWLCLYLAVCAGGYAGQKGLNRLQQILEIKGLEWFYNLEREDADPYESMTAIGYVGKLKPSDRISFRVKTGENTRLPLLLREAAYNVYNSSKWFSLYSDFSEPEADADGTAWNLGPAGNNPGDIRVSAWLRQGRGMLKLPTGAFRIEDLPVLQILQNSFAAVKVPEGPGLITYRAHYASRTAGSPPGKDDLRIPDRDQQTIFRMAEKLNILHGKEAPDAVLKKLNEFFTEHFSYSLSLQPASSPNPLADFLERTRTGHCEYFATATVLLLRAAGIPARYATGFSAHEYSPLEKQIIVRDRHAHAWALAWIGGNWRDVDNTPGNWRAEEEQNASFLQFAGDLKSWLIYRFFLWQWQQTDRKAFSGYLLWLLIPPALIPARRLWRKKRISPRPESPGEKRNIPEPDGKDSLFYCLEKKLGDRVCLRTAGETLFQWIQRIEKSEPAQEASFSFASLMPGIREILELHYRYRFDPRGIGEEEKEKMEAMIYNCMKKIDKITAPPCFAQKNPEKMYPGS